MISLQHLTQKIEESALLKKYHIPRIAIFGSYLHSKTPNDLDILIEEYQDYKDLIGFKEELTLLAETHVDLVIARFASPIIVHRAKKDAVYVS
ncbi:MAG: hypothetical protein OCC49_19310 [Fibrobacterales bacterium]